MRGESASEERFRAAGRHCGLRQQPSHGCEDQHACRRTDASYKAKKAYGVSLQPMRAVAYRIEGPICPDLEVYMATASQC